MFTAINWHRGNCRYSCHGLLGPWVHLKRGGRRLIKSSRARPVQTPFPTASVNGTATAHRISTRTALPASAFKNPLSAQGTYLTIALRSSSQQHKCPMHAPAPESDVVIATRRIMQAEASVAQAEARISQHYIEVLETLAKSARDQRLAHEALNFAKTAHSRAVNELADAKAMADVIHIRAAESNATIHVNATDGSLSLISAILSLVFISGRTFVPQAQYLAAINHRILTVSCFDICYSSHPLRHTARHSRPRIHC